VIGFEQRYRDAVVERFISAMLLTLRDCFGFGYERMNRALNGFSEIITGYDEESYYGIEKNMQNMEMMNRKMRDELAEGGIILTQDHNCISIKTVKKGGEKNGIPTAGAQNPRL